MPNAKHNIFNMSLSRPGKIHSLESYNSQPKHKDPILDLTNTSAFPGLDDTVDCKFIEGASLGPKVTHFERFNLPRQEQ